MLKRILNFTRKFLARNKKVEIKKVIFIVEADIMEDNPGRIKKKIRAVRQAVKTGINSIEGVKATRIQNKDDM